MATNRVIRHHVYFLDLRRLAKGYREQHIAKGAHQAAAFASQADRRQARVPCRLHGGYHVPGIAAGRNPPRDIARLAECLNLSSENRVEALVIAPGRQDGTVAGQRDSRQAAPLQHEAAHQFCADMFRIRRRPPIAKHKELIPVLKRVGDQFHRSGYQRGEAGARHLPHVLCRLLQRPFRSVCGFVRDRQMVAQAASPEVVSREA